MKARLQRPCRAHERLWNNICVDKNLKDEWLERLNDLNALELISICEGHAERKGCAQPHIYFKLKPELIPILMQRIDGWDADKKILNKLDSTLTDSELELRRSFQRRDGLIRYTEDIVLKIKCRKRRDTKTIDDEVISWFKASVAQVDKLDRFIGGLEG